MTEKRFILAEDSNGLYSILDTEDKEDNPLIYGVEIINLQNELNDENQELKRLIKKMGELGGFNKHLIKTICGDLE